MNDGTLISLDQPGYAWQGIIRGANVTANLLRDPDQTTYEAYPAVRNYNFDQTRLFPATPRPLDLAMPQHYGLENTFLTTYQDTTWETTIDTTISINDCYLCSSFTIDISTLAVSSVTDPVSGVTTYSYPQTITVTVSNAAAELDGSLDFGTDTVPVWALVGQDFNDMEFVMEAVDLGGITITHTGPSLTVSIGPPSTVTAFTTLPSFDFATGLTATTSIFIIDRDIEIIEETAATTVTVTTALTNEPNHTAELTFATSLALDLGELPAETGFTLDRHGNVPTVITVGQPVELPAPLALYRNPNFMQLAGIAATANWTPSTSPAPVIDAGQLFIDRRVLNPTVPVDPPIFQELTLSLSGDEDAREIGLHVPVPTMTIAGEEVFAGSLIFPETGRLVKANSFNNAAPLIITLGANGAVANITGSGGVGRPATFAKNLTVTTTLGAFPEFEETVGVAYSLEDSGSILEATSDQSLTIDARELIFKLDTAGTHTEIVDADFRAMDAILQNTSFVDPTIPPINLPELENLWFAPSAHRINIPATSEITINAPGDVASFVFPSLSTINYHTPSITDATLTLEDTDIGGWTVDRVIATRSLTPQNIKGQTLTLEDRYTQFTTPLGIDRGTNHDVSALTNHLYQNLWIRIADNLTVTLADGTEFDLPANSVINPFLGTYLAASFQEHDETTIDRLRINAPSTAVSQTELVMSRPALQLPAGITIAVGSAPLTFTGVKAIIGHSPSPLNQPVNCAAVGQGTSLLTVDQSTERVSTNILPEVEYTYDDSTANLGLSGVIEDNSRQVGDAHPCMLLDLPENTDWDSWFIYGSGTRYDANTNYPYVNDQLRMVGGRLQL